MLFGGFIGLLYVQDIHTDCQKKYYIHSTLKYYYYNRDGAYKKITKSLGIGTFSLYTLANE